MQKDVVIYKQAAIDTVKAMEDKSGKGEIAGFYNVILERVIDKLNDLPSAQPEQQWIPVSEMLPDEYGEYLVTKHTIGWNCEEYVSNDIAYFDNDGFHKADTVIAWMPLPEPHREDDAK